MLPWAAQRLIKELDQVFDRARTQLDLEVQSDYARFLVIRVSGLVEQVITEIVVNYADKRAQPPVVTHVAWRMNRFQNPSVDRILQLVASFNRGWREQLDAELTKEEREAMGSVNYQRNRIAHGEPSTISLGQVSQYYEDVKSVLNKVAELVT